MTRKKYIKKGQALMVAIAKHPETIYPKGFKIGQALKYFKGYAKNVPGIHGSYQAAWDSDVMKWARNHYLGEEV